MGLPGWLTGRGGRGPDAAVPAARATGV